jgi:hypothetical protein
MMEGSLTVPYIILADPGGPKKYVSGYTTLAGVVEQICGLGTEYEYGCRTGPPGCIG